MAKNAKGHGSSKRVNFWQHIDIVGECWVWRGGKNRKGQGVVYWEGKQRNTSRLAWELTHGPIAADKWVLHKCDNPPCINPEHLFLGTARDNVQDMDRKGRRRGKRVKFKALCHPERPYLAKGMCSACYQREYAKCRA